MLALLTLNKFGCGKCMDYIMSSWEISRFNLNMSRHILLCVYRLERSGFGSKSGQKSIFMIFLIQFLTVRKFLKILKIEAKYLSKIHLLEYMFQLHYLVSQINRPFKKNIICLIFIKFQFCALWFSRLTQKLKK